jgi:cytochrome c oxidase subunit 4
MADTEVSGDTPEPPEAGAVATEEPAPTPELEAAPGGLALVHHAAEHVHPSPVKYVGIAILLAVITALEVGMYYIDMPEWLLVAFLMVLAILKFTMVAAFFMHLKFDSPMLRRLFITGLILAAAVYTAVLMSLRALV